MSTADGILWYKAWIDTRRYFALGMTSLLGMVLALYMSYPGEPEKEFPHGALAVGVDLTRSLAHDARSYIWLHWFGNTTLIWLPLIALALASTGLPTASFEEAGTSYYTLTMPASRRKLTLIRVATGFLELAVAALLPSLLVSVLARARGQSYPASESGTHALLALAGATAFYGLFVFFGTTLGERSKAIVGLALLFLYGMTTFLIDAVRQYSIFRLMTGDMYFLRGTIPWLAIFACVACGVVLTGASLLVVERRDY
jgi:ABC-type transport system involved in multi-copper enzyme maturation permease subunit